MNLHFGERSVFQQRWIIHAVKEGKIIPLFPSRAFPEPMDSELELLEKTRYLLEKDAQFAAKWFGWSLVPVNINKSIIVRTVPEVRVA